MDNHDGKDIRQQLLRSAIKIRLKEYRQLVFERDKLYKEIKAVLSSTEFLVVEKAVKWNVKYYDRKTVKIHEQKLKRLTKNELLSYSSKDKIRNISSYHLTPDEQEALKQGLTYSVVPPKLNKSDI